MDLCVTTALSDLTNNDLDALNSDSNSGRILSGLSLLALNPKSKQMKNKEIFRNGEADQWFERNKSAFDVSKPDPEMELLLNWMLPFKDRIKSLLEVGCGGGHKLDFLSKKLAADGYGIEPSLEATKYVSQNFPGLNVKQAFADEMPFWEPFDLGSTLINSCLTV